MLASRKGSSKGIDLTQLTVDDHRKTSRLGTSKQKPNNAPIGLYVHQYTGEAMDVFAGAPAGTPCYVVILQHEAWPHVDDRILDGVSNYLAEENAQNPDFPKDLKELRKNERIWFVLTPGVEQCDRGTLV